MREKNVNAGIIKFMSDWSMMIDRMQIEKAKTRQDRLTQHLQWVPKILSSTGCSKIIRHKPSPLLVPVREVWVRVCDVLDDELRTALVLVIAVLLCDGLGHDQFTWVGKIGFKCFFSLVGYIWLYIQGVH